MKWLVENVKINKQEIICTSIFLFLALGFSVYRVQGDGHLYYKFLERFLHISNPENAIDDVQRASFVQAGCAFFNVPFYLLAYMVETVFNLHISFNGITLRQASINIASIFYVACSIVLIIRVLKQLKLDHIILPVMSVLFSTAAFSSPVVTPSFAHSVDIFVNTLFVYLFFYGEDKSAKLAFGLGVLSVVATMVRYFNFVIVIPIAIYYLYNRDYRKFIYLAAGAISFVWLIPLFFAIYNGSPLSLCPNPHITSSFFQRTPPKFPKYLVKLLVHPLHGLLVWSPAIIFSALGLFYGKKVKTSYRVIFMSTWMLFLVFYGTLYSWYGGWSFSSRYLVGLFPVFIIGIALFLDDYNRKWSIAAIVLATTYSVILFINWHLCIMNAEFDTPFDLICIWRQGKSFTSVDGDVSIHIVLSRLWEMCRYKYLLRIFT